MGHGASASGSRTSHSIVQPISRHGKADSPDPKAADAPAPEALAHQRSGESGNGTSSAAAGAGAGGLPLGSGLANRRKMNLGTVTTARSGAMDKGERIGKERPKIVIVESFAESYTLGAEVMPSTNVGMEVRHARRVSDGAAMVVKVRQKGVSFVTPDEEKEWRHSTEMLLGLPKSEHIAEIFGVMEDAKYYYVIMEKVEGMDLFELLDSEGRIPLDEAKAILRKLLQAVQELHAKGCIHKDLKLENVMVDHASPKTGNSGGTSPGGSANKRSPKLSHSSSRHSLGSESEPVVKLIDFDTVEEYTPTVRAKSVVGTDQYIAQEAYAGHYSPASDIFSCGVIAYRLISGRFPFKNQMFDDEAGENWVGSPKMKVIQDRLRHFHIDWNVPPWPTEHTARDLTRWMLQNNEKDRPTAVQALNHAFLAYTGTTPLLPQGPWGSRSRRTNGHVH